MERYRERWIVLSCSGAHVWTVLSCFPAVLSFIVLVPDIILNLMVWKSCPGGPVLEVLSRLTHTGCHVLALLFWLSLLAASSWLSYPGILALSVPSRRPVLTDLSWLSCPCLVSAVISCLSCSTPFLSQLSYDNYLAPVVQSQLPSYHVLADLSRLSFPSCLVTAVLFQLFYPGCFPVVL